jgi:GT2 family glycosyltransferase
MVSIIIINYFQKEFLKNSLCSIFSTIKSVDFEVIVVNNSPEENLNDLTEKYSNVKLISSENNGFSKGNNAGAKNASGDYYFFLNPDTFLKNDFLGKAIKLFESQNNAIIGMRLFSEGMIFQFSFGEEVSFKGEIKNKKLEKLSNKLSKEVSVKYESEYCNIIETDWVSGAAMLIKKNVFEELCGFDERYFLYYEDSDICKRAKDRGYRVIYFPDSEIIHYKGENIQDNYRKNTYYYSKESQLIYYKLHNGILENYLIRFYLFTKYLFLSVFLPSELNRKILKLSLRGKCD